MQTLRNTPITKGTVVDTKSAVSGQSYGSPVIVTDSRATDTPHSGGYDCCPATPAEITQAKNEGKYITDIG